MPNLLQESLRKTLVAAKICDFDFSDNFYIENPYGSAGTITQQAPVGTYSVAAYTSTTDTLTVTEEFVWSEQVYSIEKVAQIADIKSSRMKEAMGAMKEAVDKYVINALVDAGTGTYDTPVGGFSGANIITIMGDLQGKFAGYSMAFGKPYIVIENTDVPGLYAAGASSGFTSADTWLRNGWLADWGGFNWYVVRSGTFTSATLGTATFTNSGHRLAGIPGISTVLMPGGQMTWMEKEVSGKTGVELALAAYCGFKAWYQKLAMTIDITLK